MLLEDSRVNAADGDNATVRYASENDIFKLLKDFWRIRRLILGIITMKLFIIDFYEKRMSE